MIIVKADGNIYLDTGGEKSGVVESLIPHLSESITLEDGCRFSALFDKIVLDKPLMELVFSSHLGYYPLDSFIDEYNLQKEPLEPPNKLVISWSCEFWGMLKEPTFDIYPDVSGQDLEGNACGLDFVPLYEWKNLPFELNTEVKVFEFPSGEARLKGTRNFTVYDVLSAILYEISFYGPPSEREEKVTELKRSIEELESLSEEEKEKMLQSSEEFLKSLDDETAS